jgi:hypothetical protein
MSKQTRAYRAAPGAQQQRDQRYADAFREFECDLYDAASMARSCTLLVRMRTTGPEDSPSPFIFVESMLERMQQTYLRACDESAGG